MTLVPFETVPSGEANQRATVSQGALLTDIMGDDSAPGDLQMRMPDGPRRLVAGRHCRLDVSRELRGHRHEIAAGRDGA